MFKKITLLVYIFFAASVLLNFYLVFVVTKNQKASNNLEATIDKYPYLARRIFAQNFSDILLNFLDLRQALRVYTEPFGDKFSMYFEYLPTGTSININATREFHQASLFKLPVVMAYYHQLERLRNRNDETVILKEEDKDSEFGDLWKKPSGTKIKLSDAVRLSLVDSDNTAVKLIVPRITKKDFEDVYGSLDIDLEMDSGGATITTKGYSSILKALYFSSVLEKDDSESILNLLTKTKFIDKLPAGIPSSIPVAHKIGVFNKGEGQAEAFMDCGIVYLPNRPYVLCMYSESDEQVARERMRTISKMTYDYVLSQNPSE